MKKLYVIPISTDELKACNEKEYVLFNTIAIERKDGSGTFRTHTIGRVLDIHKIEILNEEVGKYANNVTGGIYFNVGIVANPNIKPFKPSIQALELGVFILGKNSKQKYQVIAVTKQLTGKENDEAEYEYRYTVRSLSNHMFGPYGNIGIYDKFVNIGGDPIGSILEAQDIVEVEL